MKVKVKYVLEFSDEGEITLIKEVGGKSQIMVFDSLAEFKDFVERLATLLRKGGHELIIKWAE